MLTSLALAVVLAVAGPPTKVEHWSVAGAHVVQSGRGYCWTSSIADARSDAWRCFLGKNEIVDPCFSGGESAVLCPDGTPDSHDALRIRLTKPLPLGQANPSDERDTTRSLGDRHRRRRLLLPRERRHR